MTKLLRWREIPNGEGRKSLFYTNSGHRWFKAIHSNDSQANFAKAQELLKEGYTYAPTSDI